MVGVLPRLSGFFALIGFMDKSDWVGYARVSKGSLGSLVGLFVVVAFIGGGFLMANDYSTYTNSGSTIYGHSYHFDAHKVGQYFKKYALKNIPLGRIATESDVATAITFLSSDAASMITGTNIIIDGGWTAK